LRVIRFVPEGWRPCGFGEKSRTKAGDAAGFARRLIGLPRCGDPVAAAGFVRVWLVWG
jgi:hypothetical protein